MTARASAAEQTPGNTQNFTDAVRAGSFVFVSGQASVDDDGCLWPGSFREEMERSIARLALALGEIGLGLADVVKVTCYVQDRADLPEYNRIYREQFGAPLPVRTTLTECLGGVVKFEIDAVAYTGER
ncbi:RidA family protein [Amycolatopsis thermoflava]|uniref:RidA family protein n=1 Tax=Amycolatopsis thermoflava TaxID=84480 RepID=UPI003F4A2B7B